MKTRRNDWCRYEHRSLKCRGLGLLTWSLKKLRIRKEWVMLQRSVLYAVLMTYRFSRVHILQVNNYRANRSIPRRYSKIGLKAATHFRRLEAICIQSRYSVTLSWNLLMHFAMEHRYLNRFVDMLQPSIFYKHLVVWEWVGSFDC